MSLSAYSEKAANGNSDGSNLGTEKTGESETETATNKEAEEAEDSGESGAEPDSSYYSVNKFNFLFYFVYKMKYMDEETEKNKLED